MPDDDRLSELLLAWEEEYCKGHDVSPAALCQNQPDLIPLLIARIDALKKSAWMVAPARDTSTNLGAKPSALDADRSVGDPIPMPSTLRGRYRIDGLIAEGGFGTVYRSFDLVLLRPVAIKMPKLERLAEIGQFDSFIAEARKSAQLRHPGIVPIHDLVPHQGTYDIVLGLIDGTDLSRLLESGLQPIPEAVRIIADIADALDYAHRQGVIHRDIKPSNILIDNSGVVHIADFGIAHWEGEWPKNQSEIFGTMAYMAPERLAGQDTLMGAQCDIFSLGVILHELLFGCRPAGGSPRRLAPPLLSKICMKCLAERPTDRFADAKSVAVKLRDALNGLVTVEDWTTCADPQAMLSHLLTLDASPRKMRLLACACVRRDWVRPSHVASRHAIEVAERFADGLATYADLEVAENAAWDACTGISSQAAAWAVYHADWQAAVETARIVPRHTQLEIIHDIFGSLHFQPKHIDADWLNWNLGAIRVLAQTIYDENAFDRVHLLGEALKEAGCTDTAILNHCCATSSHVRGCWVVDLLLGKV